MPASPQLSFGSLPPGSARERGQGVLVAAKPGWSYGHAHPFSEQTRRLMAAAGFAVTDRVGDEVTGR